MTEIARETGTAKWADEVMIVLALVPETVTSVVDAEESTTRVDQNAIVVEVAVEKGTAGRITVIITTVRHRGGALIGAQVAVITATIISVVVLHPPVDPGVTTAADSNFPFFLLSTNSILKFKILFFLPSLSAPVFLFNQETFSH